VARDSSHGIGSPSRASRTLRQTRQTKSVPVLGFGLIKPSPSRFLFLISQGFWRHSLKAVPRGALACDPQPEGCATSLVWETPPK